VDIFKSQRHTRSGAGRGVSQANGTAPKLTGLCQHEIVSKTLKKWKQCGWDCASQLWVPDTDQLRLQPSFSIQKLWMRI
jgi:hypothetical protein